MTLSASATFGEEIQNIPSPFLQLIHEQVLTEHFDGRTINRSGCGIKGGLSGRQESRTFGAKARYSVGRASARQETRITIFLVTGLFASIVGLKSDLQGIPWSSGLRSSQTPGRRASLAMTVFKSRNSRIHTTACRTKQARRPYLFRVQVLCVKADMLGHKRRDKEVTVIISGLHTDLHWIFRFLGCLNQ